MTKLIYCLCTNIRKVPVSSIKCNTGSTIPTRWEVSSKFLPHGAALGRVTEHAWPCQQLNSLLKEVKKEISFSSVSFSNIRPFVSHARFKITARNRCKALSAPSLFLNMTGKPLYTVMLLRNNPVKTWLFFSGVFNLKNI